MFASVRNEYEETFATPDYYHGHSCCGGCFWAGSFREARGPLWTYSAGRSRPLRSRRDTDLCGAAGIDSPQLGARVFSKSDFEESLREPGSSAGGGISAVAKR